MLGDVAMLQAWYPAGSKTNRAAAGDRSAAEEKARNRDSLKKKEAVLLAAIFLAAMLAGCGSRQGGEKDSEKMALNLQLDAEISTLDPQAAVDSASFEVIGLLMDGLYQMNGQEMPEPALAEETEVLEDGLLYRFTLREAFWSDGSPVTAADFVYGWQCGADPAQGNENAGLFRTAGIANADAVTAGDADVSELGVRALDERTLEVRLERPVPYFLSMLSLPAFFPMKESFCDTVGDGYGTSPDTVLSNGAFCLEEYEPAGQEILLTKNPDYWDSSSVKADEVSYQVIKDSQTAYMAYQSGLTDMAILSGQQAQMYEGEEGFRSVPLGSLWYLVPNLKEGDLANKNLRMALALSFDRETAAEDVLEDGSKAAQGAVPEGAMTGPDGKDFRDGAETYLTPDKGLAAEYLEKAKEELGKDSFSFVILIEDTDTAGDLGQYLQEEISRTLPGVTIELEAVPKKMRLERMAQGDFEIGLTRWGADYPDPLAFLDLWSSGSAFNYGSWENQEYDAIIREAREGSLLSDAAARWEVLHQAESVLMEDAGIFPVCEKAVSMLLNPNLEGEEFHTVGITRVWKRAWKGM